MKYFSFKVYVLFIIFFLLFISILNLPKIPTSIFLNKWNNSTKIYSNDGHILSTLGSNKFIKLRKISKEFIYAIISTEDHCFLDHSGINKLRFLKAIFITLFKKHEIQGASTITQQLSKNFFFDLRKTYLRKLRELLISFQIEFQFSKRHILETYLNHIFFGFDAYGIENASNLFFAKQSSSLSLSEASLLAGLPKSPKLYNPYRYPKKAKKRQIMVLKRMLKSNFISKDELNYAYKKNLKFRISNKENKNNSYFVDFILKYLKKKYCCNLLHNVGLNVYTTVDFQLQNLAESVLNEGLKNINNKMDVLRKENKNNNNYIELQGAIISIDANSGDIKAMVGGKNFYESQFNRSTKSKRHSSSNFRPFLYYSSFLHGRFGLKDSFFSKKIFTTNSDTEILYFTQLKNKGLKKTSLKTSFMNSINVVATKLFKIVGPINITKLAKRFGFKDYLKSVYSFSPKTNATEISSTFSVFSLSGIYKNPQYIKYIKRFDGKLIENHTGTLYNALNPYLCSKLIEIMKDFVDCFFKQSIKYIRIKKTYIGFTALSNWHNDAWITGFTPLLCSTVWIGCDKNYFLESNHLKKGINSTTAISIWSSFAIKSSRIYNLNKFLCNLNFLIIESRKYKKTRFWTKNKKNFKIFIYDKDGNNHKKLIKYFYRN